MFIIRFLSQVYICSLLHFENTGPKNSSVHFLIAFFFCDAHHSIPVLTDTERVFGKQLELAEQCSRKNS